MRVVVKQCCTKSGLGSIPRWETAGDMRCCQKPRAAKSADASQAQAEAAAEIIRKTLKSH
jgi:hypothetical protein